MSELLAKVVVIGNNNKKNIKSYEYNMNTNICVWKHQMKQQNKG